jgi:hypothetical protein
MPVTDQSFKNLLRLGLILELVQKRNYPSKADILQHLAKHDLAIDDRTFERLLFLVRLVPTLTATSVLQCLMSSPVANGSTEDKSRLWFQSLFQDEFERKRMQSFDPKVLHPAVITQLSFALGINIGNDTVFQS